MLWLCDETLFGSAKNNIIFTETGIYAKLGAKHLTIKWEKLVKTEYNIESKEFHFYLSENQILKIDGIYIYENKKEAPVYLEFFNKIAKFVNNNSNHF